MLVEFGFFRGKFYIELERRLFKGKSRGFVGGSGIRILELGYVCR